jgi:hypothetical protein
LGLSARCDVSASAALAKRGQTDEAGGEQHALMGWGRFDAKGEARPWMHGPQPGFVARARLRFGRTADVPSVRFQD